MKNDGPGIEKPFLLLDIDTWREEDPSRRNNFLLGLHAEKLSPYGFQVEKELKMAIVNDKNMKFGPISALFNSFKYYLSAVPSNSLQLVTPNEIVGLYCYAWITHGTACRHFCLLCPSVRIFLERSSVKLPLRVIQYY